MKIGSLVKYVGGRVGANYGETVPGIVLKCLTWHKVLGFRKNRRVVLIESNSDGYKTIRIHAKQITKVKK